LRIYDVFMSEFFCGRKEEIALLRRAIASERAELGIVYGRRRIGKSTLLQQPLRKKGDLFFEGIRGLPQQKQIDHFLDQLARQSEIPRARARDWREAFDALSYHIGKGKHYVVFDEFPWMASGKTELVALLKYYWDNEWKKNPRLTLVLCGSVAAFMQRHLIHSEALHNRKTFELKLEPLPSNEAKEFFKSFRSGVEAARFLMVFGGVPKYLEQVDPTRSLAENLDALCFHKHGFFVNEFETIFKEQFKVARTYETMVRALSKGRCSREDLASRLKMSAGGGFSSYLETLAQADFVRVFHPVCITGNEGRGSKTTRVELWDEWLRFYFNYVAPNRKRIGLNTKPGLFEAVAGRSFDTWCGVGFENLCLKNLPVVLENLGIPLESVLDFGPFFRQGSRGGDGEASKVGKGLQIDLVLRRKGGILTLIECKFRSRPVGLSVVRDMERKIEFLAAPRSMTVERILLCAGEVTADLASAGYFHRIGGVEVLF